ncbi:MAG: response regulator transcription factor [Defluviitaleaceae bacterium]|nr:response regulator transcription factor [Defluviitaleaceae bacterium]MCL2263657.1 response regulator transcription factor [Defluviitaleaceae bacterium]MCL2263890.1 response regulator transcription factor [Defluviitaleaceae bacterium]MCL2264148.1 response regulator transcription factor [Defluviitaleaceae bacterium]
MAHILVVEDDQDINEIICKNLKLVGHSYAQAFDGIEAVKLATETEFDLILLDVMLPGLDGFSVFKKIPFAPVIFITAKDGLDSKLNGLKLGADDYIVKPFEMLELLARAEAVLRRTQKNITTFCLDEVNVNMTDRTVKVGNEYADLSPKEFELLEVLIRNQNIALSRDKLLELAWGYDYLGETRTVDNHIQKLRSKLGWESRIKTIYKLGYRLEVK